MTRLIDADELNEYIGREALDTREKIFALVDRMPTVERPHGEWILCSERLPEKSGEYYVSGGDKVWICSFLIIPTFKGGWCNNVSNPVVEAWMPLPEPYKEEGDLND